jgi:hypothetical protein
MSLHRLRTASPIRVTISLSIAAGGGRSSRVHREIALEYRNAPQNNPLDFRQQIVAPVQCRAHTLLDPLLPPFRVEGLATACGSFAQPYAQVDALTE